MTETGPGITRVLADVREGRKGASEELLPLVYEELRKLAHSRLAGERGAMTLPATALVHEAYLRLLEDSDRGWDNRGHFFAAAAIAMRRVAVEYARAARRRKRGGDLRRVTLDTMPDEASHPATDLLDLDRALVELENQDPDMARVVNLRYFAGLTVEETARAMDLSPRTVNRRWTAARAWLNRALADRGPAD